jgi:Lon protease-like protein
VDGTLTRAAPKRNNGNMQSSLLPLFPLQVVVFPRTRLPLHIFEERYKEMVGEAVRDQSEFGIVLAKEDGILNAGCTVVVEKVLKTHPDGRMDIMTRGVRRFEIVMVNQEKSYLRGEVSYFDDDEPGPGPSEIRSAALSLYESWIEFEGRGAANEAMLSDAQLSFQLAQGIEDPDFLHYLLRSRSEAMRLKKLAEFLADYVPRQKLTASMKKLAPLNGHSTRTPPEM